MASVALSHQEKTISKMTGFASTKDRYDRSSMVKLVDNYIPQLLARNYSSSCHQAARPADSGIFHFLFAHIDISGVPPYSKPPSRAVQ
jgi:hypothetical protein